MMFAQATNQLPDPHSPAAVGWACVVAVCIIVGLRQVMGFVREFRKPEGPERRDVTISGPCASKAELERHTEWDAKEHEKLWSKVGGVERGTGDKIAGEIKALRDERHSDATELQKRLSGFEKSIGGLDKATELQNQALVQIQVTLSNNRSRGTH